MFLLKWPRQQNVPHSEYPHCEGDVVPPGHTQHVGQVQGEVDDATACCCQVCSREQRADQEALQDGRRGEGRQEKEDHCRVTVGQNISSLEGGKHTDTDTHRCLFHTVEISFQYQTGASAGSAAVYNPASTRYYT